MGCFREPEQIKEVLQRHSFNDSAEVERFLGEVDGMLRRTAEGVELDIDAVDLQFTKGHGVASAYDFLYSLDYLKPEYSLSVRGRDVRVLSPGERGILLLVFYLLADRDVRPLLIDQPEENLDNESVYEFLVPCVRDAKRRRQVFLVTHNPNLAVVCNAEQVIWTQIDKEAANTVTYVCGGIENPTINRKLVDVLEGTWPAFRDREIKYQEDAAGDA